MNYTPTGLTISDLACDSITLSWHNIYPPDITINLIERYYTAAWHTILTVGPTYETVHVPLPEDTICPLRVSAIDYTGGTFSSTAITATTFICIAPPTSLWSEAKINRLKLHWTNQEFDYIDGIQITQWNGSGYTQIAMLSSGATSYWVTGLTPNTNYSFNICTYYNSSGYCANISPITTNYVYSNYSKTDITTYGASDGIIEFIQQSGGTGTYKYSIATPPDYYSTTGFTGLSAGTYNLYIIDYYDDENYFNVASGVEILDENINYAPSGLTITNLQCNSFILHWVNNGGFPPLVINLMQKFYSGSWHTFGTADISDTSKLIGVPENSTTILRVTCADTGGTYYSSAPITATTFLCMPLPFCATQHFTITNATCGNSNGKITIAEIRYFNFYDFVLTDIQGNIFTFNPITGIAGSLQANYYFLTATVKPSYWYYYGHETCQFDWLKVTDSNTTITLISTKIRNAVCQGFGTQTGRIVFQLTDSNPAITGWTFTLYNERLEKVNEQVLTGTFTGLTNIQYLSKPDNYYGILENNLGCTYLIDLTKVQGEQIYTVTEITDVYLTPWTAGVSYNYYSNTDDDYYVAGLDPLQFTSSKIKEFNNLTDYWYKINLVTAVATYGQTLEKGENGLVYNEIFTLTIPHADNSKYKELTNILTGRYIIVFRDANGLYWTLGYRAGTEVRSYQLNENQYAISFISPSVSHMLTNLDINYVKISIL